MTQLETPGDLLRRIYDEEFGFLPTNSSMKPVHVANGLARRVLGVQSEQAPLARTVRQFVENQKGGRWKVERNPNSAILEEFSDRFSDRHGNAPSDEAMTRFRSLAKDTLGADDAVFPPPATQTSFTLSHESMITGDVSDGGSGDFLAGLLRAGHPAVEAPAADLLAELLRSDTDPWTTIAWPLLDLSPSIEARFGDAAQERAARSASLLATDKGGRLLSPSLRGLRERADQLARYEHDAGSKLTTLRRLVMFGTFAIHVHMVRRCHDVDSESSLPPLLLDMFDGRRRSLREASAATLQGGFRSIERLVLARIGQHLDQVCGKSPGGFLASMPEGEPWAAVQAEYQAHLSGAALPIDALAEAFWQVGYSGIGPKESRGYPWNALLALGRRAGYLLPYDNRGRGGKEHKRYGANAEFAEVLVASVVAPGEPLDFDDFLDELRKSFGVVLGRATDFDAIRRNDLRPAASVGRSISVIEGDLRANLHAFRDLIIEIGFGKSYADGRTIVTTGEAAA